MNSNKNNGIKVIFLDHDGVMVTKRSVKASANRPFARFDRRCVVYLNNLIKRTGAKIVVSSSWRLAHPKYQNLYEIYKDEGIEAEIFDMTPILNCGDSTRGDEISAWFTMRDSIAIPIANFVILDDDRDMGSLIDHLIWTNFENGLTKKHVEAAIRMLGVIP